MNTHDARILVSVAVASVLLFSSSAWAQGSGEARVERLHEQAVEAYTNLEMDDATDLLDRALEVAEGEGVTGTTVARVRLTYAVVLILGLNRLADGRHQMVSAIQEDSTVEPPAELSAPLVDQLWDDVRSEHAGSDTPTEDPNEVVQFGQTSVVVANVEEQLPQRAIPIYAELEQAQDMSRIILAYRGPNMRRYLRIEMAEHGSGYAGRIACHRVEEPSVEYFVEVLDSRGEVIARAGSEEEPRRVVVRRELEGSAPHLPGEPPEPPCSEDEREEVTVTPTERSRIMYFEVNIGTGAGVPYSSQQEQLSCTSEGATVTDRINITPAVAWTELVLVPEFGFYIGPHIALGVRGRLQIPGAVYPGGPFSWAVLARVRWFVLPRDPYRLSLHLAGGYGTVSHPIALEGEVNCHDQFDRESTGTLVYHRQAGAGIVQLGGAFIWDLHRNFGIGAELDISILFPTFAVQGDLLLVMNASF